MTKSKKKTEQEPEVAAEAVEVTEEQQQDQPADELEQMTAERDHFKDKYHRALAELQNYQRRVARERQELMDRTKVDTIEQFLFPVIDDLDRAVAAANQHGYDEKDPLFSGVNMVHRRMIELLKQYGIELIDAVGKPFDPQYHQAMMEQPTEEHAEGTVMQVLSHGYTQNGRTIRPAKVIVAKKAEQKKETKEEQEQE